MGAAATKHTPQLPRLLKSITSSLMVTLSNYFNRKYIAFFS